MISGTLHSVLTAVHLVMGKIKEEATNTEEIDDEEKIPIDEDGNLNVLILFINLLFLYIFIIGKIKYSSTFVWCCDW